MAVAEENVTAKRCVYHIEGMESARVKGNIAYRQVDGQSLAMDVYYPPNFQKSTRLLAVIFVGGDGPPEMIMGSKDWGAYVSWGQLTAAYGLIAVTFNHRSTQGFRSLSDASDDVSDLIDYVLENDRDLGVDSDRLCIWTCSAGPPFALLRALEEAPKFIKCLVSLYGLMDLQHLRAALSEEISNETLKTYSPVTHLQDGPSPAMLIAKAGVDQIELNDSIDRFVATATAGNYELDFMTHPHGHHGFDVLDDDARSRTIVKRALDFMAEHLNG
jgi:acetyl esterase/lipase